MPESTMGVGTGAINEMTDQEIERWRQKIDAMSHEDLARLWRFAPSGHSVFDQRLPVYPHFEARFAAFGGMTSAISKRIGWAAAAR